MGTILDKLQGVLNTKGSIRQAIVSMGQAVAETDPFASYADKIRAIRTGVETSDATAVAGDILSGKTAYVKGQKVTGTISSVTHPAPAQSLDASSNSNYAYIKASHTQESGNVTGGTTTHNYQITRRSGGTYTPGESSVQLAPAGLSYFDRELSMGPIILPTMQIAITTKKAFKYLYVNYLRNPPSFVRSGSILSAYDTVNMSNFVGTKLISVIRGPYVMINYIGEIDSTLFVDVSEELYVSAGHPYQTTAQNPNSWHAYIGMNGDYPSGSISLSFPY